MAFCLNGGVALHQRIIASKEFGYDVTAFTIIDKDERYNEMIILMLLLEI